MERYADANKIMRELGMDAPDKATDPEALVNTRTIYRIRQALDAAAVADAVPVTRCGKCIYGVTVRGADYRRCLNPNLPSHKVPADGYCNWAKPKGETGNGKT